MRANVFPDYHRWANDTNSLGHLPVEVEFDDVVVVERFYREDDYPDLGQPDGRVPSKSVYVEAKKARR